jgi:hypothetical protein
MNACVVPSHGMLYWYAFSFNVFSVALVSSLQALHLQEECDGLCEPVLFDSSIPTREYGTKAAHADVQGILNLQLQVA